MRPVPSPGDRVLIGKPGISMPADWFIAKVLWADRTEMLVEHNPPSGRPTTNRQVLEVEYVRATGSISELRQFKERCRKTVEAQMELVRSLEFRLGKAREAVWEELDKIAGEAK